MEWREGGRGLLLSQKGKRFHLCGGHNPKDGREYKRLFDEVVDDGEENLKRRVWKSGSKREGMFWKFYNKGGKGK